MIQVLNQTGFEKSKRVFTAWWSQYRLTARPVAPEAIRDSLKEWMEEDRMVLESNDAEAA